MSGPDSYVTHEEYLRRWAADPSTFGESEGVLTGAAAAAYGRAVLEHAGVDIEALGRRMATQLRRTASLSSSDPTSGTSDQGHRLGPHAAEAAPAAVDDGADVGVSFSGRGMPVSRNQGQPLPPGSPSSPITSTAIAAGVVAGMDERPERYGLQWDESDYRDLAALIRQGRSLEGVSAALGRTLRAVTARLGWLGQLADLDPDEQLVDVIAQDRYFDVVALARDTHSRSRVPFWTDAMDGELRRAWQDRSPGLTELVTSLDVREAEILTRLVLLDLARNTADAVEHLGCDPDGNVGTWRRIAADRAAVMLWVLILTDATSTPVHVSLHAQADDAHAELEELRPDPDTPPDPRTPRFWTILPRVAGETTARKGESGAFELPPETDPAHDPIEAAESAAKRRRRRRRDLAPPPRRRVVEDDDGNPIKDHTERRIIL